MRLASIFIFILGLCVHVQAATDEKPKYQLHQPSAVEFVEALDDIVSRGEGELYLEFNGNTKTVYATETLVNLLDQIIVQTYANTADPTLLEDAYQALNLGTMGGYAHYYSYLDQTTWNQMIVKRWLEQSPVGLDGFVQIQLGRYTINLAHHNFDGVGEDEILLTVESDDFADHWLAIPDDSETIGYRLETTPLPYRAEGYWWAQPHGLGANTYFIEDLNADGKLEWVARGFSTFPGNINVGGYQDFYLMGWREGKMQLLTAAEFQNQDGSLEIRTFIPDSVNEGSVWHFENIDNDEAQELIQVERFRDNWNCIRTQEAVYDWNGIYYLRGEVEETIPQTMNCALRQAQQAMEAGNYQIATRFYQQAISRYDGDFAVSPDAENTDAQFAAYAQERLVIAYTLSGWSSNAMEILNSLRDHPLLADSIAEALLTIPFDDFRPYRVCSTAYSFLNTHYQNRIYRNLTRIGRTSDNIDIENPIGYRVDPAIVGCNPVESLINLTNSRKFDGITPPDFLTSLGVKIADSGHLDMNGDGHDEWIVWMEDPLETLFFAWVDDLYLVSTVSLRERPSFSHTIQPFALPENGGLALLEINREFKDGYKCFVPDSEILHPAQAYIVLRQLQDNRLVTTLGEFLCESPELGKIFVENRLYAWGNSAYDRDIGMYVTPVVYQWDAQIQEYVQQGVSDPAIVATQATEAALADQFDSLNGQVHDTITAYHAGNYQEAVHISDQFLSDYQSLFSDDFALVLQLRHWRALSYMALNQEEMALAEYITIYESAPESAWGQLAHLYLKPPEG